MPTWFLLIVFSVAIVMIILVIGFTVGKPKSKPAQRTPASPQPMPQPPVTGPAVVGIYQYRVGGNRVVCRCCETENRQGAVVCNTCGEPLNR